jgi:hypothetical protein
MMMIRTGGWPSINVSWVSSDHATGGRRWPHGVVFLMGRRNVTRTLLVCILSDRLPDSTKYTLLAVLISVLGNKPGRKPQRTAPIRRTYGQHVHADWRQNTVMELLYIITSMQAKL